MILHTGFSISAVIDVQGVNYQYGDLDDWHSRRSLQPMLNSESAACTCSRGIYKSVFNNETVHQSVRKCFAHYLGCDRGVGGGYRVISQSPPWGL